MGQLPGVTLSVLVAAAFAAATTRPISQQSTAPPGFLTAPRPSAPQAQNAPASGVITGTVVDGSTGAAIEGAAVSLARVGPGPSLAGLQNRQVTDERGRFAFTDVPGGAQYTIAATKSGYLDGTFGRETAPTDPLRTIALRPGEWVSDVRVSIWKPGSIFGVVRDETGDPVVGVYVRALLEFRFADRSELAAGPIAVTDDRGAYRLLGLSPGRYLVQVPSVQASLPATTAQSGPPSSAGRVAALDSTTAARPAIGRYPLPPPVSGGRAMAYGPTFHPGAASATQAARIDLNYGDNRAGIDVALSPVSAVRVSGTVEAPDALQRLTLRLLPSGLETLGQGAELATALVGADGRFTFLNVPAGSYTIEPLTRIGEFVSGWSNSRMRLPPPPGQPGGGWRVDNIDVAPGVSFLSLDFGGGGITYSGRASVVVEAGDIEGVVVRLRPSVTVSGRIEQEADPARPDVKPPTRFVVTLDPAGDGGAMHVPRGSARSDSPAREFTIAGVRPARYWLRVQAPGWLVKSVAWNGHDHAVAPLDATAAVNLSNVVVTVTSRIPELSGSVRGTNTLDPDQTIVIAVPRDPNAWTGTGLWPDRMNASPVTASGAFSFNTLPAGEYLVAAVDRQFSGTWRDPAFLKQVAGAATPVTLLWGRVTQQDLTPVVVR